MMPINYVETLTVMRTIADRTSLEIDIKIKAAWPTCAHR